MSAVRYILTFFVSWKIDGLDISDLAFELLFLLIYVLLDVTQVAVVLALTHMLLKSKDAAHEIRTKALVSLGKPVPDHLEEEAQQCNIVSMHGPLHKATLIGGAMIAFVRVGGRIIYDIGYGAPADGGDLAWMVFYYMTDIAIAILGCAAIRLICLRTLFPKNND